MCDHVQTGERTSRDLASTGVGILICSAVHSNVEPEPKPGKVFSPIHGKLSVPAQRKVRHSQQRPVTAKDFAPDRSNGQKEMRVDGGASAWFARLAGLSRLGRRMKSRCRLEVEEEACEVSGGGRSGHVMKMQLLRAG